MTNRKNVGSASHDDGELTDEENKGEVDIGYDNHGVLRSHGGILIVQEGDTAFRTPFKRQRARNQSMQDKDPHKESMDEESIGYKGNQLISEGRNQLELEIVEEFPDDDPQQDSFAKIMSDTHNILHDGEEPQIESEESRKEHDKFGGKNNIKALEEVMHKLDM